MFSRNPHQEIKGWTSAWHFLSTFIHARHKCLKNVIMLHKIRSVNLVHFVFPAKSVFLDLFVIRKFWMAPSQPTPLVAFSVIFVHARTQVSKIFIMLYILHNAKKSSTFAFPAKLFLCNGKLRIILHNLSGGIFCQVLRSRTANPLKKCYYAVLHRVDKSRKFHISRRMLKLFELGKFCLGPTQPPLAQGEA